MERVERYIEMLPTKRETDWIQKFCGSDPEEDAISLRRRSSMKSEMYVYHGDPLDWLPWSGLFFALVHNQPLTSYEKLGILLKCLSLKCQRVIGGIQGDQRGYMRALNLLRVRYGNPEHLRATYLGTLRSTYLGSTGGLLCILPFGE